MVCVEDSPLVSPGFIFVLHLSEELGVLEDSRSSLAFVVLCAAVEASPFFSM